MSRGYNTKGGSNGHSNHADPKSTFLLFLLICVNMFGGFLNSQNENFQKSAHEKI